ncbi:DsbA family protein [Planosporangium thailandense]|uniref:DsbA family protein n=1 Tax=Planosporangium thailandense TaxID=765197 RepID=A0ABX0Y4I1_9ACTN|nr:DsbA family protein [Planosporangium thailandense]NJC72279.1 DsbA family protein [Planosporangium thailandense]
MDEDVTLWFDPSCPFTWRTSRWLVAVTRPRGHRIGWRLMSLGILNEGKEIPEQYRETAARAVRGRRLLQAAGDRYGQEALARLYTEIGERVHEQHRPMDTDVFVESIAAAGLPAELIEAVDDDSLEAAIRESHDAGQARVGTPSGSPIVAIGDRPGFFGPVVVPVPEGESAEKLYDALRLLSAVPEFSEVKRARAAF